MNKFTKYILIAVMCVSFSFGIKNAKAETSSSNKRTIETCAKAHVSEVLTFCDGFYEIKGYEESESISINDTDTKMYLLNEKQSKSGYCVYEEQENTSNSLKFYEIDYDGDSKNDNLVADFNNGIYDTQKVPLQNYQMGKFKNSILSPSESSDYSSKYVSYLDSKGYVFLINFIYMTDFVKPESETGCNKYFTIRTSTPNDSTSINTGKSEIDGKIERTKSSGCNIFGPEGSKTRGLITTAFKIIRYLIPILIIILGVTDFLGAVFSGEDKNVKEAQKRFIMRLVAGVILLFIPALLKLLIGISGIIIGGGTDNSDVFCGFLG